MTEFIDKLKNELIKVQDSINELLGFKELFDSIKKIWNFFDTFFTIVPPELILLLIFSAFILILINNISPTTPRFNITFAVVIFSLIWLFINKTFFGEYKILRVFYTSLYILIPAYFLAISRFIYNFIQNRKKIDTSKDLVPSIKEINLQYYEFLNAQTEFEKNPAQFITSVKKLKNSLSNLENKL